MAAAKKASYGRRFAGAVRRALVEETRRGDGGGIVALTDNYLHVTLDGYEGPGNVFVDVRLAEEGGRLTGTPAS
jgi:hypothetical protein